jgi:hypothetical protein
LKVAIYVTRKYHLICVAISGSAGWTESGPRAPSIETLSNTQVHSHQNVQYNYGGVKSSDNLGSRPGLLVPISTPPLHLDFRSPGLMKYTGFLSTSEDHHGVNKVETSREEPREGIDGGHKYSYKTGMIMQADATLSSQSAAKERLGLSELPKCNKSHSGTKTHRPCTRTNRAVPT